MLKASVLQGFWAHSILKTRKFTSKSITKDASTFRFVVALVLVVGNLSLLFSYVYGVNDLASKGYSIKTLQKSVGTLSEANKKLSVETSEASSMISVQGASAIANFVPAGTPRYLEVNPSRFTQR